MATERTKQAIETAVEGKKRGVSMEINRLTRKKKIPTAYQPNQNINKHNMALFYKVWKSTMKFN